MKLEHSIRQPLVPWCDTQNNVNSGASVLLIMGYFSTSMVVQQHAQYDFCYGLDSHFCVSLSTLDTLTKQTFSYIKYTVKRVKH